MFNVCSRAIKTNRQLIQKQNDAIIERKFGYNNHITKCFAYITGTLIGPIISFFKKNGFAIASGILGFVFLFKIGEAFLGRMSIIFYKEIGFSKGEIAIYSKRTWLDHYHCFYIIRWLLAMRAGTIKTMFLLED